MSADDMDDLGIPDFMSDSEMEEAMAGVSVASQSLMILTDQLEQARFERMAAFFASKVFADNPRLEAITFEIDDEDYDPYEDEGTEPYTVILEADGKKRPPSLLPGINLYGLDDYERCPFPGRTLKREEIDQVLRQCQANELRILRAVRDQADADLKSTQKRGIS